jgi:hypothetical protein
MILDRIKKIGLFEVALHAYVSSARKYDPHVFIKDAIADFLRSYGYEDDPDTVHRAYMAFYRMQQKLVQIKEGGDGKVKIVVDTIASVKDTYKLLNK